jgi:drug/metabolite transporter (DMT)-like permease
MAANTEPAFHWPINSRESQSVKPILTVLGVVLLVIAGVYFVIPADQLPGFLPGHEAGVTHVHTKHGIVAAMAGVVLLAAGVWVGRK